MKIIIVMAMAFLFNGIVFNTRSVDGENTLNHRSPATEEKTSDLFSAKPENLKEIVDFINPVTAKTKEPVVETVETKEPVVEIVETKEPVVEIVEIKEPVEETVAVTEDATVEETVVVTEDATVEETVVVTEEDEEEDCVTCAIKTSFDDIVSEIMELLEDRTMAMKLLNLKKDERSNIEIMEFLNNVYLSLDTHNENFSFHSVADLDFKFDMNEILLRSAFNGTYTGPIAYENSLGVNPFNTVYDLDINWMNYFNPLGNGEYNYRHTGRAPTQLFRGPNVYQSHYNQRIPIDNFTFHSERPNLGIGIPFLLQ